MEMKKVLVLCGALVGAGVVSGEASAGTLHRVPVSSNYGWISSWFDHNPNPGVFLRYDGTTLGGRDGHSGIDFPIVGGIWASANGKVIHTKTDCLDYPNPQGLPPDTACGGSLGNHVRLLHPDWTVSIYGHMKKGSVAVATGWQILCSRLLGNTGNSGASDGIHLHYVIWSDQNATTKIDPFAGPASHPGVRYWVNQNFGLPTTQCE